jgi:hypothetical protein
VSLGGVLHWEKVVGKRLEKAEQGVKRLKAEIPVWQHTALSILGRAGGRKSISCVHSWKFVDRSPAGKKKRQVSSQDSAESGVIFL